MTQSRRVHVVRMELLRNTLQQRMTLQARRGFDQFGRGLDRLVCDSDQLGRSEPDQKLYFWMGLKLYRVNIFFGSSSDVSRLTLQGVRMELLRNMFHQRMTLQASQSF